MTPAPTTALPLARDLVGRSTGVIRREWDGSRAALYALSVGAGGDDATRELEYTFDGPGQRVLPAYSSIIGRRHPDAYDLLPGIDHSRVLQAAVGLEWPEPREIPASGSASVSTTVSAVHDHPQGSLISLRTGARVADGPELWCTSTVLARGYRVSGAGARPPSVPAPAGPPAATTRQTLHQEQALLHRLLGDRNPIHVDPVAAAAAGLDWPIVHGLCTFGFAARALAGEVCPEAPESLRSMGARLAHPVRPGDTLELRAWRDGPLAYRFEAWVGDRVVLRDGRLTLHGADHD